MHTIRSLAFATAVSTYGLIVLGTVVRITESGMGCGDHWPMCNGRLIPSLSDVATLIEWTHRLVALVVSGLIVALALAAFRYRSTPGVAGRGGPLRPALLAVLLLAVQVMLGAVTVSLELPPATVILHLSAAMALLATVMVAGFRSGTPLPGLAPRDGGERTALIATTLGGAVILLGGVTASLGAGPSCQGFPLCSGQLWPTGESGLPAVHWVHRLVAYALFAYLAAVTFGVNRSRPHPIPALTRLTFALAAAQVAVAAAMVLLARPTVWRALHAAVGTAVWAALVWWTLVAWSLARPAVPTQPAA